MMNINDLSNASNKLGNFRKPILDIIQIKTDDDMEKVLMKMEAMEKKYQMLVWVVTTAFSIIAILLAIIAFKK
ncbi:MAG: hypothetical protein QM528_08985 [Phycisphaerales bacterium]|nr:hypothetical protein [Phycisphaerales bacterium]